MSLRILAVVPAFVLALAAGAAGVDYEHEPIRYSKAPANNVITRLQARLDAGDLKLAFTEEHGYLPALLRELRVPVSSQVLVFSATSQQRHTITPEAPRAIYFSDEVHLGYVRGGFLELAVADPELGIVFYQVQQTRAAPPKFVRMTDNCLTCHSSGRTRQVPGLQVRSVFVEPNGQPIVAAGSFRTDQTSPLSQRWGGWYVSGTHGDQQHLGNLVLPTKQKPKIIDNKAGQNVTDLSKFFDVKPYLTPHSDIVALMVLEHQIDMHNYLSRLRFATRLALRGDTKPADDRTPEQIISEEAELVVKQLLLSKETVLTAPIRGTSSFAKDFPEAGRRDSKQRSLRDLDLERRLFKFPCSYLIDSPVFDSLPPAAKKAVYRRLWEVLNNKDSGEDYAHLSGDDRRNIVDILRATKADLPEYWR